MYAQPCRVRAAATPASQARTHRWTPSALIHPYCIHINHLHGQGWHWGYHATHQYASQHGQGIHGCLDGLEPHRNHSPIATSRYLLLVTATMRDLNNTKKYKDFFWDVWGTQRESQAREEETCTTGAREVRVNQKISTASAPIPPHDPDRGCCKNFHRACGGTMQNSANMTDKITERRVAFFYQRAARWHIGSLPTQIGRQAAISLLKRAGVQSPICRYKPVDT